jgi:hypothetical protein
VNLAPVEGRTQRRQDTEIKLQHFSGQDKEVKLNMDILPTKVCPDILLSFTSL